MEPPVRKAHNSHRRFAKDGSQPLGDLPKDPARDVPPRRQSEGHAQPSGDYTRYLDYSLKGKFLSRSMHV